MYITPLTDLFSLKNPVWRTALFTVQVLVAKHVLEQRGSEGSERAGECCDSLVLSGQIAPGVCLTPELLLVKFFCHVGW